MKDIFKSIKREFTVIQVRWIIRRKFGQFFRIARKARCLGILEANGVHWNESQMHFYSANVLAQSLHKLESIRVLIERGLTADAWPIVRALIENVLDHNYILRNPEKLDLYFKYSTYLDIQYVKRMIERRPLTPEEQTEFEKMQQEWERFKPVFQTKNGIRRAWRDKSLEELGKQIKLDNIYSLVYREANDYVHSNSNLIRHFILGQNEQGLLLKAGGVVNGRDIFLITAVSLALVCILLHRTNKYFALKLDAEITALDKEIVTYHAKDVLN